MRGSSYVLIRELAANSLVRNLKRRNLSTFLARRVKSAAQPNSNKRRKLIKRSSKNYSSRLRKKKTKMRRKERKES